MPLVTKYNEHSVENEEAPIFWKFLTDNASKDEGFDSYESSRWPIFGLNFMGAIQLLICEPETVRDLFTNKNLFIDKDGS